VAEKEKYVILRRTKPYSPEVGGYRVIQEVVEYIDLMTKDDAFGDFHPLVGRAVIKSLLSGRKAWDPTDETVTLIPPEGRKAIADIAAKVIDQVQMRLNAMAEVAQNLKQL
jgi:hypothetical protein